MTDTVSSPPTATTNPNDNKSLSSSSATTPNGSLPANEEQSTATALPASRRLKLQQMLWHSLMEAKGEIVSVTTTNGDTFSGILYAIESHDTSAPSATPNGSSHSTESISTHAPWKYLYLKYVQKMPDPNLNPADRIKTAFIEEMKIPSSEFAALSAINITDHTNSYRRSDRQAFNDASGRKMHRKQRELVAWEPSNDTINDEGMTATDLLENDEDLEDLRNGYDQFKANNMEHATFDENMYTAKLDKNNVEYQQQLKHAEAEEARIMSTDCKNKHVMDDRAYYINSNKQRNGGDEDEEDAYSRVLHDASLSKQNLKDNTAKNNKKSSYIPPQLRKDRTIQSHNKNNNGDHRENKRKNQHKNNQQQQQQQRAPHRPPPHNNNNNNKQQQQTQQTQPPQPQNNIVTSPNTANMAESNAALQQIQAQQLLLQAQQQMAAAAGGGLFAGLPPNIAQIVQSVNAPLQHYQINALLQQPQNTLNIGAPQKDNKANTEQPPQQQQEQTNNEQTQTEGAGQHTAKAQDDGGSLNPNAIEFTPQIPNNNKGATSPSNAQNQPPQAQNPLSVLPPQQQQLLQAAQYNFNPATQQYVLNPYAQQDPNQLLALQQHGQIQPYLQHLAIQQQLAAQQAKGGQPGGGQPDPTGNVAQFQALQHQQQAVALQQALQQQQQQQAAMQQALQAQAAQTGLNIGAPLFTPSNMLQPNQPQTTQQNQQQQAMQQALQQQQQQIAIQQQQQIQAQQYLHGMQGAPPSFGIFHGQQATPNQQPPQQQFYMMTQ